MEPLPENMTGEQFLKDLENTHQTLQEKYETESKNLANLEQQQTDADDSIALIEDDIHILFEDPIPDILLYRAMKADLLLTIDGLNEITQAIEAKKALIDQISEGLTKAEVGIKAMKLFIARTGIVLPLKKDT
jgi:hypothetical protein